MRLNIITVILFPTTCSSSCLATSPTRDADCTIDAVTVTVGIGVGAVGAPAVGIEGANGRMLGLLHSLVLVLVLVLVPLLVLASLHSLLPPYWC